MSELKIPGFSEYLHAYSDGLLFGLGNDVDARTGLINSLKVSMFDNSNPYNVKEKDKLILEDLAYSVALDNYKEILVDAGKSMIAFQADGKYVIIKYDRVDGFKRMPDVNPELYVFDDGEGGKYDSYYGLRGLFIGDVLYVIAPNVVKTYNMNDDFKKIDSVTIDEGAMNVGSESYKHLPGYTPEDGYGYYDYVIEY